MLSDFMSLNTPGQKFNDYSADDVKMAIERKYDWSFLPSAILSIIKREDLGTVEILEALQRYKFADEATLASIMSYATGLSFVVKTSVKIPDIYAETCKDNNFFVENESNGLDAAVYIGAHSIISQASISVIISKRNINFFYLLPYTYKIIENPNYNSDSLWDYNLLFNRYILYCLDNKATDIHFDVVHEGKTPVYRALCRISTDREVCKLFPMTQLMNKLLIREVISRRSSNPSATLDLDNNTRVVVSIKDVFGDESLTVRLTANKVLNGYYCVCRLQKLETSEFTIDKLGFSEDVVKLLEENTERPSGLTIFSGKLRTGKNTTMNSVANVIVDKPQMFSLLAIDNPPEFLGRYPQVDYQGNIAALKDYINAAKKQDLDFVTLNEIPSSEVAFGVQDLVNSSIHVMTTWHQNRIWHLPYKLFEFFGLSYRDILSQVNLICNQRLYKRQCPNCCISERYRDYYQNDPRIYKFFVKYQITSSMVSTGCEICDYTGYQRGSIVVLPEILKFEADLVLELSKCDKPYQMELILMECVLNSSFSLEQQMKIALISGKLGPKDVLSIV